MDIRKDLRYTKDHEWALQESAQAIKVGISDYAQHELGDVVFVDLPKVGDVVAAGNTMLTVESVKAVSDVYAPISGKIVAVNSLLEKSPEKVNNDPYVQGWMVVIEPSAENEYGKLLSSEAYSALIAEVSK